MTRQLDLSFLRGPSIRYALQFNYLLQNVSLICNVPFLLRHWMHPKTRHCHRCASLPRGQTIRVQHQRQHHCNELLLPQPLLSCHDAKWFDIAVQMWRQWWAQLHQDLSWGLMEILAAHGWGRTLWMQCVQDWGSWHCRLCTISVEFVKDLARIGVRLNAKSRTGRI